MVKRDFDFIFFSGILYGHILFGRTGAMVNELTRRGFFINYFEKPPDSIFHYYRERGAYEGRYLNFLFPKIRLKEKVAIYSFSPYFPTVRLKSGLVRKFNFIRFDWRLKNYLKKIKKKGRPTVCLVINPWWYNIINKSDLEPLLLCYDYIDDISVFCSKEELPLFQKLHQRLVKEADLIFVSAKSLEDDIIKINRAVPIEYLPNAVDEKMFATKTFEVPELQNLPKPIIGFVGALFHWVDLELITKIAQVFKNASVVLVGPVQNVQIPEIANLYVLGPRPPSLIPAYIKSFDVCLVPFRKSILTEKADPLKIYEYLALGKPVVATDLEEFKKNEHLIYLAKNSDEFIEFIKKSLKEHNPQLVLERIRYAQNNTWKVRIDKFLETIEAHLSKKLRLLT